jgi:hypothetical protein
MAEGMMNSHRVLHQARMKAAALANAEDASMWRWFSALLEERRLRWCLSDAGWLISLDNRHVSTAASFDAAIRGAKIRAEAGQR